MPAVDGDSLVRLHESRCRVGSNTTCAALGTTRISNRDKLPALHFGRHVTSHPVLRVEITVSNPFVFGGGGGRVLPGFPGSPARH